MQPTSKSDGFRPKFRNFHPQATVWVKNILDHDVIYQVADENNTPYQYRLPTGKISELPGGSIASLGVKALVDELIQNNPKDVLMIWEPTVRAKYEDQIIVKLKEAPQGVAVDRDTNEVNLGVADDVEDIENDEPATTPEEAFPGLTGKAIKDLAKASAGKKDAVIEQD